MGAWGAGSFDNDDASDFADSVAEKNDLAVIEAAFDKVLGAGSEHLEAPIASEAIAGAEILTLLLDRPSANTEYPEEIDEWTAASEHIPADALVAKARNAMDRVLIPPSELLELWAEGEDLATWKASVEDLKSRLVPQPHKA
jgi:hypothetical protein